MKPTSDSMKAERARRFGTLLAQISNWLNMANVPVAIVESSKAGQSWPNGSEAGFAPKGVFGLLAIQLFHNIMGSRGFANCTHCGRAFPTTRERTGTRRFCSFSIDDKIPSRYASRDWWRKTKPRTQVERNGEGDHADLSSQLYLVGDRASGLVRS